MTVATTTFDPDCVDCPRLADFLSDVRLDNPGYFAAPVPPFGDAEARLLIVGLAPGMHGANRTGRPFTGDHAGIILYQVLHELGLATAAESIAVDDGMQLQGARITNAVKCLPPQNKPTGQEIKTCNRYLRAELEGARHGVILALGRIAHEAVLRALDLRQREYAFGHGAIHVLPDGRTLVDSYHCSRYNLHTRRLTGQMFAEVMTVARDLARKLP